MAKIFVVKPEIEVIDDIEKLRGNRPWFVSDLDGTLTRGSERLLMETFVLQNRELGERKVREELVNLFEAWHRGEINSEMYEKYLLAIGNKWAEMLFKAHETRANVMQVADNWFKAEGDQHVMPYAGPMMRESERFRFNRLLLTGAPVEIAYPFAAHIGMEHVVAMMAPTDADGRYSDSEISRNQNTGIQTNKSNFCIELANKRGLGLGAGDTLSDSGIALPTIMKDPNNPRDIPGRFLLMNPRADVLKAVRTSLGQFINSGQITVVDRDATTKRALEIFRETVFGIMSDNNKLGLLFMMLGKKDMTQEEVEAANERLDKAGRKGSEWFL